MEAIIEENPTAHVISGNVGNIGNKMPESSNSKALTIGSLSPNGVSRTENQWEQTELTINTFSPDDSPVIPHRYKALKIDGETVPQSGQWIYRDSQGKFLFYVQRFDNSTGRKEFRPLMLIETETGMKWMRKAPSEPRPLYGLDRLAANPNAEVIICEGEKATDAAEHLFPDLVAVCSMNGANSPEKSDWSPLAGRNVFLWGDFDEPGNKYIATVEKLAIAFGAKVTYCIRPEWFLETESELGIERDELPSGWDAADAEQEGFTSENIQIFLDQEKKEKHTTSLFGQTPSQQAAFTAEFADSNSNDKQTCNEGANQKRTQAQELFKDSEFAVIEFRKRFKNGVYWQEPFGDEDTPKPPLFLCSPLIVVAETRDTDQSNWGRLLSWLDNDGHAHNWACPVEMLAATDTAEFRRELARNGLTIATNGKARQKLVDYVLNFSPQSKDRVRCVTKTGWYGSRYVLSNCVFGKQEGESVIYQGVTNGDFGSAGSLIDWKRKVSARAVGNTRIVFAISVAFAGPLMQMANESGGGFQFTGETSKGKTSTVIDPAASVWGHPDHFAKKWRTTANGLEALCLSRNHSTLILDDLGQSDAKECGQAAYLIANGQGKVRMQKEGGNRPLSTWKTLILSSGEVDITQHMAEAGKVAKGGQVIRLPSIPADAGVGMFALEQLHDQPDGRQFSDMMKAVTRDYYGTAGAAFLDKLTDSVMLKETTDSIRECITEIVKAMPIPEAAAPEIGRVAARFALVAYAGELATKFDITGWNKGEAIKAAIRCFNDWLSESGGAMGADDKVLLAQVSSYLQAHGASRFPPHNISAEDLQRVQNRAGFSYIHGENVYYWAESGVFTRELCKGFNSTAAAKILIKAGWLVPGSDRIQQKKHIAAIGGKKLWFYVFTDKALGGDL